MVRLFIKDNVHGTVREYGTDRHDSLVSVEGGRFLEYYNLQNGCGSMFPEEGYSFVHADGKPFAEPDDYADIGGECVPDVVYCEECKYKGINMLDIDEIRELTLSRTPGGNLLKLFEEMGELAQAIGKDFEHCGLPQNRENLIEEMADVTICLAILRQMYNIEEAEFEDMIHRKMWRNMQRLK